MKEPKYPSGQLTVVIRDDSPMIHCNDSPRYRTVRLTLTPEQREALKLRCTGSSGGAAIYEEVSMCILEPERLEVM